MLIIGCDFHPGWQQICWLDLETGETGEQKLGNRRIREIEEVGPFWQVRFVDFNGYTHRKRVEKIRYMHNNPVKRELVRGPGEWKWSSYRFYRYGEIQPVKIRWE